MKVFYGLKPTPISEMMAQGIGACLLTSSFATLWVAKTQPVPVQTRFAIIHLICAFAMKTQPNGSWPSKFPKQKKFG